MEPQDVIEFKKVQNEVDRLAQLVENEFPANTDYKGSMGVQFIVFAAATRDRVNDADKQYGAQEELYKHFQELLTQVVNRQPVDMALGKEAIFHAVIRKWRHYRVVQRWMFKTFAYLTRFYVAHCNKKPLEYVASSIFFTQVFKSVSATMSSVLLNFVAHERSGDDVDKEAMRQAVELFVAMSTNEGATAHTSEFIEPCLKETAAFYKRESNRLIAEASATTYLEKAAQWLDDEKGRGIRMLPPQLQLALIRVVEDEVLAAHLNTLIHMPQTGFAAMLRDQRMDHIKLMYTVMSRLKAHGVDPMAALLGEHCRKEGEAVSKRHSGAQEVDFRNYVLDFIELHEKYMPMLAAQLGNHVAFQIAIKNAFETSVNIGITVQDATGTSSNVTSSELLSNYCDSLLKNGGEKLTDEEMDDAFSKVVSLFTRITEKDLFQEHLRKHLSKRLLNGGTINEEMEKVLISKLKATCGASFTSRLEGMINDKESSVQVNVGFREHLHNINANWNFDFTCQVLTMGFWPSFTSDKMVVPRIAHHAMETFAGFHSMGKQHRVLTWVNSLGSVTVTASFTKGTKELSMSVYQAAVLLLFNTGLASTLGDIQSATNLEWEEIKRVAQSFTHPRARIMNKTGETALKTSDTLTVNEEFSSTQKKMKMPVAVQRIAAAASAKLAAAVEDDRRPAIDACIVRIMKSRKMMDHTMLVSDIIEQLSTRFKPDPKLIKQRIEDLINREYLERHQNNPSTYVYLA